MKNFVLSFAAVLFVAMSGMAQTGGPAISVDKEVHDYGTIKQGANGACDFLITNTGTEPLIISNAKGSCGCTVPEWPKQPIMPGQSASVTVRYDTKRVGPINKSVTISSNATNSPEMVVRIKGNVLESANANDMPVREQSGVPVAN
jgi:hypothetical protein